MATKQSNIRLTDTDKANIKAIQEWLSFPSASAVIRYAINHLYREMAYKEAQANSGEARHNYNRGLGLD